jgi:hypothetical protein
VAESAVGAPREAPTEPPTFSPATIHDPQRWWDSCDWWADGRLAYAKGLADGYAAGRADRDAVDDAVHRVAVRSAANVIAMVDRRRACDRGEVAA